MGNIGGNDHFAIQKHILAHLGKEKKKGNGMPKRAATYHLTEPALAPPQKKRGKKVSTAKRNPIYPQSHQTFKNKLSMNNKEIPNKILSKTTINPNAQVRTIY